MPCKTQEWQWHQAGPILCPAEQSVDACLTYRYADSFISAFIELNAIFQCAEVLLACRLVILLVLSPIHIDSQIEIGCN